MRTLPSALFASGVALVAVACLITGCASNGATSVRVAKDSSSGVKHQSVSEATYVAALARGDAAWKGGQLYEALRQYIAAAETDSKADVPLLRIAMLHESAGEWELAIRALQLAEQRDAHQGNTAQRLGFLWLQLGNSERATSAFERALQFDAKLWGSSMGLGLIAEHGGDFNKARLHYGEALALQPSSPELLAYSARTELALGSATRARELADLSLAAKPSAVARLVIGDIVASSGDYAGALDTYLTVMAPAPSYERLGQQAMQRRDYVSAVGFLESAVRNSPAYFETAQQRLAVAREQLAAVGRVR